MGGIVLHQGKIAEMRTGEGKTLTATLPSRSTRSPAAAPTHHRQRLSRQARHPVDGPDLQRARAVDRLHPARERVPLRPDLGITRGRAPQVPPPVSKQEAYAADITYGTNNEFGFDYLRDNMVVSAEQRVQRRSIYAIVDEVDNILIDEARTPLIISGQAEQATDRYYQFAQIVKQLREGRHYEIDLKHKIGHPHRRGHRPRRGAGRHPGRRKHLRRALHRPDPLPGAGAQGQRRLPPRQGLHRPPDGEIIIVDEFTGRMMPGRRWSEGLHQAIEAKEGVRVRRQNVTMATITFQNYFRMYEKLAGMTGTAKTEAEEFLRIYNLDVVSIPTHRPMIREDFGDLVFKNEHGKFGAVVDEIEEMRQIGRPVLVGTTSIEASERLSRHAQAARHRPRRPQRQAARARSRDRRPGRPAGRGHDRHQHGRAAAPTSCSARASKRRAASTSSAPSGTRPAGSTTSLRGRAGRQGDPGSSRFFVSLEDELMRRFGSERISGLMDRLGMDEDMPIEHGMICKIDRERPDEGRRPQLRPPQARRPVRRRDEPPPRGDLRRPRRDRRRRGHVEDKVMDFDRRRDREDRRQRNFPEKRCGRTRPRGAARRYHGPYPQLARSTSRTSKA